MQKYIISGLFILGSLLCIHASWLPTKAWLSQVLISHSWQRSQVTGDTIKPWPWADTFAIAELSFQRLNHKVVILNGGDPTTLAFSAGAVAPFNQTTSHKPFVVAGHRDSHFSFLEKVTMKDIISLTDKHGQTQLYQVEAIDIVDAAGALPLLADSALVLITCYPFNDNGNTSNERYIITAKQL